VDILEDQHQRRFLGQRIEGRRQHVERVLVGAPGREIVAIGVCRGDGIHEPAGRVAAKRFLDRRTLGAVPELGNRFQHRQVGLATAVLLDALAARDPDMGARRPPEVAEGHVDRGRLADPGLAADEPELPPATGRRPQPGGDLGALALASHHETMGRTIVVDVGGRGRDGAGHRRGSHRGDEAVPEARHGLDEARCRGLVPKHRAQLSRRQPQDVFGHRDARPDRVEQSPLRHQLARPLRQVLEEGEGLGPQGHPLAVAAQLPAAHVELERRELDDQRAMRYSELPIYGKSQGFLRTREKLRRIGPGMERKQPQHRALAGTEVPLPPERAFVVQLRPQANPGEEIFVGRVEHIASGEFVRFGSAAELLAFMANEGRAMPR
jgi:hypothetical protein